MAHLLSLVLFLPLVFGIAILFLPEDRPKLHGQIAMAGAILTLIASVPLFTAYHPAGASFQFAEFAPWIGSLGINYNLGIDGISLLLVLMTTAIFPFVVGVSLGQDRERSKMYYFLLMMVETAIIGTFVSLNLMLFYIFYEAMLIPLYFLIGIWGGSKRVYATLKFFLFTMAGSMLMLVSILSIYFMVGSFDYDTILTKLPNALALYGSKKELVETLLFLGFFAAFAVKAPVFPLHTWVPDAYAEAPIAGSIVLVALKMGLYGFIRFNLPFFPTASQDLAPIFVILGVIGVIYAALIASMQTDLKRLIAYSSISHIGVIVVAIFSLTAIGISGSVVQMVSHTITTGALFILIGLLFARRGSYDISAYGGVMRVMPILSVVLLIATLSSIALPGTSGFTGEFMMLIGAFQTYPWQAGLATTAAIWSAVYMLWMYQRVMHGRITSPEVEQMKDLTMGETWGLIAPLIAVMIFLGVYPSPVLQKLNPPVATILAEQVRVPSLSSSPLVTDAAPPTASIPHQRGLARVATR